MEMMKQSWKKEYTKRHDPNEAVNMQSCNCFSKNVLCASYLPDPRSSSDEVLLVPAGEEESPSEEE